VGAAAGWGALSAGSLVLGALLALVRTWPKGLLGAVLAVGAGALISAVAFELAEEGLKGGGAGWVGIGLGAGALVYFVLDRALDRGGSAGVALALGAFLDGIPEQAVLGIGLAGGAGVGIGLLLAIFVSNLPEATGSAADMRARGRAGREVVALWVAVAVVCTAATVAGYALADGVSGEAKATIDGFAAGALLVMLTDSMIPDAREKAGRAAGLATVLGFAIAAALSKLTA